MRRRTSASPRATTTPAGRSSSDRHGNAKVQHGRRSPSQWIWSDREQKYVSASSPEASTVLSAGVASDTNPFAGITSSSRKTFGPSFASVVLEAVREEHERQYEEFYHNQAQQQSMQYYTGPSSVDLYGSSMYTAPMPLYNYFAAPRRDDDVPPNPSDQPFPYAREHSFLVDTPFRCPRRPRAHDGLMMKDPWLEQHLLARSMRMMRERMRFPEGYGDALLAAEEVEEEEEIRQTYLRHAQATPAAVPLPYGLWTPQGPAAPDHVQGPDAWYAAAQRLWLAERIEARHAHTDDHHRSHHEREAELMTREHTPPKQTTAVVVDEASSKPQQPEVQGSAVEEEKEPDHVGAETSAFDDAVAQHRDFVQSLAEEVEHVKWDEVQDPFEYLSLRVKEETFKTLSSAQASELSQPRTVFVDHNAEDSATDSAAVQEWRVLQRQCEVEIEQQWGLRPVL